MGWSAESMLREALPVPYSMDPVPLLKYVWAIRNRPSVHSRAHRRRAKSVAFSSGAAIRTSAGRSGSVRNLPANPFRRWATPMLDYL